MWKDILKSDPCTRKVKKVLYEVLEKLGANNELLDEIKTQDENTLREMMEEFSRTQDGNQKEIFSNMLEGWDMCIQAAKENPTSTTNFDSDYDMMYASMDIQKRGMKLHHPSLKEAILDATNNDNLVHNNNMFQRRVQEIYKEKLLKNGFNPSAIGDHVKYKAAPNRISTLVGRYLTTMDYLRERHGRYRKE